MEADLVFRLELQPINSKVISSNGIFSNIADNSNKAKGVALVPTFVPEKLQSF
jgi:hypothetical protein